MKKQNGSRILALSVVCALALAGCGGGGGGGSSTPTATTPTGTTTGTTVDTTTDTTVDNPVDTTTDTTVGTPVDTPVDNPVDNPIDTPVYNPDTTPPIVTIQGEKSITIEEFTTSYIELGATADDETDGNVSVNIIGDVGDQPNVYTITYEAFDKSGNRGTAERYVTVTAHPEDTNKTKINVLALYTNGSSALYEGDVETRLIQIMAVTNQIHDASKTGVEVVLAHSEETAKINDTDSMYVGIETARTDADIAQIRDNAQADGVLVYQLLNEAEFVCGLGYLNDVLQPEFAISILGINCATEDTAHELGHNMGNSHSYLQDGEGYVGIYPYSRGHIVEGDFGTIMSYASDYGAGQKLVFSSPELECNGQPCGIEAGEAGEADASRTIRETKTAISEFR